MNADLRRDLVRVASESNSERVRCARSSLGRDQLGDPVAAEDGRTTCLSGSSTGCRMQTQNDPGSAEWPTVPARDLDSLSLATSGLGNSREK